MNYREAREEDASRLVEMANQEVMQQNLSEEAMQDLVQDRSMTVAEDEDDVVGYVSYRVVDSAVVVQHVCVEPEYRDGEVPRELLNRPLEFAETENMRTRVAVERGSWLEGSDVLDGFEHVADASFGDEDLVIYER